VSDPTPEERASRTREIKEGLRDRLNAGGSAERRKSLNRALVEQHQNLLSRELEVLEAETVLALTRAAEWSDTVRELTLADHEGRADDMTSMLQTERELHKTEVNELGQEIEQLRETTRLNEEELATLQGGREIIMRQRDHAALLASVRLGLYHVTRTRLRNASEVSEHRNGLIADLDAQNTMLRDRLRTLGDESYLDALDSSSS
jgi:DNA-binding transcriptional regulator YiaG